MELTVQVLHTVANPIRKAAIEALSKNSMRFSQLLASCNLDYNHDAGHFSYHLSELIDKRIVKKDGDTYHLTEFGSKIAEILRSLEKEYSFLLKGREDKGGEVMKEEITTNWLSSHDFDRLLGKDVRDEEAKLPQPEKEKLERFKKWGFPSGDKRYYHPRILVAKKGNDILGWLKTVGAITYAGLNIVPRVLITNLLLLAPAFLHQRGEIAYLLLKELLKQAEEHGATSIEAININAEDEELLTVFKKIGFERTSVGYNLRKIIGEQTFEYIPTIGPSPVSCEKCGGRKFRFVKKEEANGKECVVYACIKCGQTKRVKS